MNRYTIYCTEEQAKKALELGAPIEEFCGLCPTAYIDGIVYDIPTAEQMIEWLEDKGIYINIWFDDTIYYVKVKSVDKGRLGLNKFFSTRKEAALAAIDAALEYLSNYNISNKRRT